MLAGVAQIFRRDSPGLHHDQRGSRRSQNAHRDRSHRFKARMSFVYVANADGQDISVFRLESDGALKVCATVAAQSPPQTGRSMLLAISPDQRFLYAAYLSGGSHFAVTTYAIGGADGIPVAQGTAALADSMAYMVTDQSGRYLLCASYAGSRVTVN